MDLATMRITIGTVAALFRYPVKSMCGERLDAANLGWFGLEGDRRLAWRRPEDRGGFPWLTASRLPDLIRFVPIRAAQESGSVASPAADALPTHVRTPGGAELELFGAALAAEVGGRHGAAVEMVHLNRGIFDEASVSVITGATVVEIGRLAAQPPDVRRFRPNILVAASDEAPFQEDVWVGGVLTFGTAADAAALCVTHHDERCAMVNLDPDSARATPEVLKAIVRERGNKAGIYGAVARRGRLAVGQPIFFEPAPGLSPRTSRA